MSVSSLGEVGNQSPILILVIVFEFCRCKVYIAQQSAGVSQVIAQGSLAVAWRIFSHCNMPTSRYNSLACRDCYLCRLSLSVVGQARVTPRQSTNRSFPSYYNWALRLLLCSILVPSIKQDTTRAFPHQLIVRYSRRSQLHTHAVGSGTVDTPSGSGKPRETSHTGTKDMKGANDVLLKAKPCMNKK